MKKSTRHPDESVPQSVSRKARGHNGRESIQIGFTDQRISPRAGLWPWADFLHRCRFREVLEKAMPQRRSPNHIACADLALGFLAGVLSGSTKLAHCAQLRGDPLMADLLGVKRLGSQSSYTRFFGLFSSARFNSECFGRLWRWSLEQLSSSRAGFTLDLDSTHLLHEDAHQKEGVRSSYTPEGMRRCLHPLLGMISEANLVAGFWLRPGNTRSDNNAVAFTAELLDRLPSWVRLGLVRADSGFCDERLMAFLETKALPYIIVARLHQPTRSLISRASHWKATELPGTEVAELLLQTWGWSRARRVVLIRHQVKQRPEAGGRELIECPGYRFQALITSLPTSVDGLMVWRRYNGRAGCENIIKELATSYALPQLCLGKFFATEAALSLSVMAYNLCVLFQQRVGWEDRVNTATLRQRLFMIGGVISRSGGYLTVRLAVPEGPLRDWWQSLLEKLRCRWLNCIAVPPKPPNAPVSARKLHAYPTLI